MGQCNCADGHNFKLKALNGWYLIKLYHGCKDCGIEAGFMINKDREGMFIQDVEDFDFKNSFVKLVSLESLKKALQEEFDEYEDLFYDEEAMQRVFKNMLE